MKLETRQNGKTGQQREERKVEEASIGICPTVSLVLEGRPVSARSYLSGTFRRSSSKKFFEEISWFNACCASIASTGMNTTAPLPSESRLQFDPLL